MQFAKQNSLNLNRKNLEIMVVEVFLRSNAGKRARIECITIKEIMTQYIPNNNKQYSQFVCK